MKLLNGIELASYIKERQVRSVRRLVQEFKIKPKLAIIVTVDNPIINLYIRLKKQYGQDIGIDVDVNRLKQSEVKDKIKQLNLDPTVSGIIIQLPLQDIQETDQLVNLVLPSKDVDSLGEGAIYDPATPMAILWLLAGHGIDLKNKKVLLIGKGKLVGKPLFKMLKNSDVDVSMADRSTQDLKSLTINSDVIITATGSPAIIYSDMIKESAVIVDAGTASEDGKIIGDVADDVYERQDLSITPKKGGVGPLTVCALFENVILAVNQSISKTSHKTIKN